MGYRRDPLAVIKDAVTSDGFYADPPLSAGCLPLADL
jgi:hypothetical protein